MEKTLGYSDIVSRLESLKNLKNIEGMARFGVNTQNAYGISLPDLRKLAKEIGKNHELAQQIWNTNIHEARMLASMIDEVSKVTQEQMEQWVHKFDSWDVCDQVCGNLFRHTPFAYTKALEWAVRSEEFVKRAGFTLMAGLAVSDKKADNKKFWPFFDLIKQEAYDERNFVKKAVNWALRQIGKRNRALNKIAIETALEIKNLQLKGAQWIASDALKELQSNTIQNRLSL